jgi:ankyrin repeat protein
VEPALVDTCEWLYENDTYKKWQGIGANEHLARPNMIWIKGKPGAGKSTLMKEAVRRAKRQAASDSIIVVEFFFSSRRNVDLERTPLGLLRTLLHQLLQNDLMLMAEFLQLWRKKRNTLSEGWQWHRNELQDFLGSVFSQAAREGAKEIFFFIDALDECDERSVRDLVNFFKGLSAAPNLHICLSSRHFPHISVANCPEIVVEDANRHDIEIYVERKLSRGAYQRSQLTTEIFGKASGVFLWVALVVNLLNKDIDDGKTTEDIADTLRMVPAQLDDLFKNLLGDLTESERERSRAVNLMQWVLLAARPLTLKEMQHALAFGLDPRLTSFHGMIGSKSYIDDHDCLARFIRSHSRGLIEVKPRFLPFFSWWRRFNYSLANKKLWIDDGDFHSRQVDQFVVPLPEQLDMSRLRDQFALAQESGAQSSLDISPYESNSAEFTSRVLAPATCQRLFSHFRSAAASKASSGFFEPGTWLDEEDIASKMRLVEYMVKSYPEVGKVIDQYLTDVSGSQTVQVIHESVREFFLYGQGFKILDSVAIASDAGQRHRSLLSTCIRYLGVEDLKDLDDGRMARVINRASPEFASPLINTYHVTGMEQKLFGPNIFEKRAARYAYAFLDYTATNLFYHATKAENHEVIPEELMDALRNEHDTFWKRWKSLQYRNEFSEDTTPLYALCEKHLFLCAAKFLNSGANTNEKGGLYSYPIIATLARARASVASKNESSNNVEVVTRRKSESMVRLLLKHRADPNVMSKSGESVLHFAVNTSNPAVVSLLITEGAAINACDREGRTPLHEAACLQSTEIIAVLLSNNAQVRVCDVDGNTPLHLAAKLSSLAVVQQLVQAGSIVHQLNKLGFSALHFASQSDRSEIFSYLQGELRSDGGSGSQQRTALHTAAESGSLKTISIFLAVGADLEACDEDQRTPLHVAARWAEDGAVRLLLDSGSDLNAVDRHLQTPLHLAAKAGASTLLTLVEKGVNVNALDEDDRTSLHIAAKDGTAKSVRILLEAGADPRLLDRFGRSARYYARAHRSLWLLLDDKTKNLLI